MRKRFQITEYCHHFLEEFICEGDVCIDATAGNGNDTEFLCRNVGENGKVYAFDIQEEAISNTKTRLEEAGLHERAELILDSHENMKTYVKEEASIIMFNFGYLPGGDHQIATKSDSSIRAIEEGLSLLKINGIMNLCIYSGGDTGYEERDNILSYIKELDTKRWLVIMSTFYNRKNDPPIPVFIIRLK